MTDRHNHSSGDDCMECHLESLRRKPFASPPMTDETVRAEGHRLWGEALDFRMRAVKSGDRNDRNAAVEAEGRVYAWMQRATARPAAPPSVPRLNRDDAEWLLRLSDDDVFDPADATRLKEIALGGQSFERFCAARGSPQRPSESTETG